MQSSVRSLLSVSRLVKTSLPLKTANNLICSRQLLLCTRELRTSPMLGMPRYSGGGGNITGDKLRFACPKCKSMIMFYCKFAGTRRHIRCHKCNYLITVEHSIVEKPRDGQDGAPSLIDVLEGFEASMSEGNNRLGRLFAPSYEEPQSEDSNAPLLGTAPPPKEIFSYLDKYVQGQDRAKRVLAVSIYNHYKRLHALKSEQDENVPKLDKSNVLLIGPTGSGKTYMFQMVAKLLDVPLVVCDCTSLTQAGYVGEDVESVIVRLWQAAGQDVERTQRGIVVLDELDKLASKRNKHGGKDIGGEGVQQSLLKIIEGTNVTVTDKAKNKTFQIDTRDILFLASGAFIGLEQTIKRRTATKSLGFGSPMSSEHQLRAANIEDQKKLGGPMTNLPESRRNRLKQIKDTEEKNRIKDQLLSQVEPKDILDYGVIPELAGRLPVVVTLDTLTTDDLVVIATNKERGVISQLVELLSLNDCVLEFTDDALQSVAELAFCKKTGARALKSIVETTLLDAMFDIPGSDIERVTITSETVLEKDPAVYVRRNSDSTTKQKQ